MHVGGELFGELGLGEPHRLSPLKCSRDGPQLLQPGDPINPGSIAARTLIDESVGEFGQHLIQPRDHPVCRRRLGVGC
jgi:hypothetical protein